MSIWYVTPESPDGVPLQRGAWIEAFDVATATGWWPQDETFCNFTTEEGRALAAIWRAAAEAGHYASGCCGEKRRLSFTRTFKRLAEEWSSGPIRVSR